MSDLSYLETLSNKELHAKCLEYDLPNIPVTDTSRNVILRRLRATILGEPRKNAVTAAKKTPRRETIHSSKSRPTTNTSPTANTNVSRISDKTPSRSNNNNNRRTIAATPRERYSSNISSIRSAETTTTVSDVGSQSEDDDDFYLIESPQSRKQQTHNELRPRRSVSLSKSGVLTTSYTREVQSAYQETEEEPQSYTYKRPETVQSTPSYTLPIYEPRIEPSYRPELSRQNLTHTQLNSTSYFEAANNYDKPPMKQSQRDSGSRAPFAVTDSSTSPTRSFGDSGFPRGRLLEPIYNAKSLYPQLNEFYDQQNNRPDPMEVDTDTETEPEPESPLNQRQYHQPLNDNYNSPYVSWFSNQMDSRQRSSPLSRPQMRSTIRQPNPKTPAQKFSAMLISLDRQYHLKFYLFLLLAIMIATFIYVMVTPAV